MCDFVYGTMRFALAPVHAISGLGVGFSEGVANLASNLPHLDVGHWPRFEVALV